MLSLFKKVLNHQAKVYSQKEEFQKLRNNGFSSIKSRFGRIISNLNYHWGIHLKAFKNESEQVIKGVYESLI